MSHFSPVQTKITDQQMLTQAITMSGFKSQMGGFARGYQGQGLECQVVAVLDGDYDIGFQSNNGEFTAIADFSLGTCGGGSRSLQGELAKIIAHYNLLHARKQTAEAGLANAHVQVQVH